MNRLFNQLRPQNNNGIGNLFNTLRASRDPMNTLSSMAGNNPAIAQMLQELQASGGDARGLFFKKAREMGIDPQSILSKMK